MRLKWCPLFLVLLGLSAVFSLCLLPVRAQEPLSSWNESPAKAAIIDFVSKVTISGSSEFVPEAERIAVFDNDGTLWSEQPVYFQLLFAIDRVKTLAPEHPEWLRRQPFKAVLEKYWKVIYPFQLN